MQTDNSVRGKIEYAQYGTWFIEFSPANQDPSELKKVFASAVTGAKVVFGSRARPTHQPAVFEIGGPLPGGGFYRASKGNYPPPRFEVARIRKALPQNTELGMVAQEIERKIFAHWLNPGNGPSVAQLEKSVHPFLVGFQKRLPQGDRLLMRMEGGNDRVLGTYVQLSHTQSKVRLRLDISQWDRDAKTVCGELVGGDRSARRKYIQQYIPLLVQAAQGEGASQIVIQKIHPLDRSIWEGEKLQFEVETSETPWGAARQLK